MATENEIFRTDDGNSFATGLNMPTEAEQLLMANAPEYPDSFKLDPKDIERGLVINGQQVYLKDRERHQPWMRHQGNIGKCNASSNASGIEQLRNEQGMPHIAMSDAFLYMLINGGVDRGSGLIVSLRELLKPGYICPAELQVAGMNKLFPNDAFNTRQVPKDILAQARIEAQRFMGIEWYRVPDNFADFKVVIASALARRQKVIWAWHVGGGSMRLKTGGYINVGRGPGNHSNLLHSGKWVGGSDLVHPDNQNSWGPCVNPAYGRVTDLGWGERGYALCTMEDVYACHRNHATYVQVGMKVDPNDPAFQK